MTVIRSRRIKGSTVTLRDLYKDTFIQREEYERLCKKHGWAGIPGAIVYDTMDVQVINGHPEQVPQGCKESA